MPNISKGYGGSALVFYGRHLGTKKSIDFYHSNGYPITIENFEVVQVYKGLDSSIFFSVLNEQHYFRISLKSTSQYSCGQGFDSSKYYLVYVTRDLMSGYLISDGCNRTREIINGNFICTESLDDDIGKDERKELLIIKQKDTAPYDLSTLIEQNQLKNLSLLSDNAQLIKSLTFYKILCWVTGLILFLLIIVKIKRYI